VFCVCLPLPAAAALYPRFKAHKSAITCCCFAGDVLYTGANRVRSWSSSSSSSSGGGGMVMLCELDLSSRVAILFAPPDSPLLWACCDDGRICVLSRELQLTTTLINGKSAVTCITSVPSPALPSSSLIWTGRSDGSLHACAPPPHSSSLKL
jgi:hypothetical protein